MTWNGRHNCSIWLAMWHAFVSASLLWWDQSLRLHSSCCFNLSCPKKKNDKKWNFSCANRWVGKGGRLKVCWSPPFKKSDASCIYTCSCGSRTWQERGLLKRHTLNENEMKKSFRPIGHRGLACLNVANCWRRQFGNKRKKSTKKFKTAGGTLWRRLKDGELKEKKGEWRQPSRKKRREEDKVL